MRNSLIGVVGVASLLLLSCDDSDGGGGGGSCGTFTPCGGDVVGTWSVKNMCVTNTQGLMVEDCPTAKVSVNNFSGSGTVTYNANMTRSSNISFKGSMSMSLPASCLMGVSCPVIDGLLKSMVTNDPEAPFSSVSCTGTDPCTCAFTFKETPMMSSGTWMTSGNKLIEDGEENEYCVSGKTMNLRTPMGMAGMMEDLGFSAVLEKQ